MKITNTNIEFNGLTGLFYFRFFTLNNDGWRETKLVHMITQNELKRPPFK